jgi:two-component system torCAD operon response regulator TorR
MTNQATVLIVDDEVITRSCLSSYFEQEGYRVFEAETAEQAESIIQQQGIHLVLLDIRLPGKDGLTLTRELRVGSEIGIILVTGRQDELDRIVGLECGADEYVTKPFNPREILARAKNLIRRVQGAQITPDEQGRATHQLAFSDWVLDTHRRLLTDHKQHQEQLTEGEFQLLMALINQSGQTMTRDQLMDKIRNREWVPNDRTIDVLIGRLRRKLRDDPTSPHLILTIHGSGYLFTAQVQE